MTADGGGALLDQNFTGGDYFRAMGIELLHGRTFTNDEAVTPNTNVDRQPVGGREALARTQNPLGQRLRRSVAATARSGSPSSASSRT